ncbi:hypothetical protein Ade02nite_06080 [Paractinoplanes deccanensis]|uniref:Uncharacterized protein n=1 Tax=Paractinoplanes deccanensis TaxID=113561 RepID=A0ABQ3XW52_9ACTN|nr:hypothetical protein Ade02nite_06080 [Actinoplanes deccanensis]
MPERTAASLEDPHRTDGTRDRIGPEEAEKRGTDAIRPAGEQLTASGELRRRLWIVRRSGGKLWDR